MEVFMKMLFTFILLVSTQLVLADSISSRKIKEEMLTRVDMLIEKSAKGREAVKKENMEEACKLIKEIFAILPDHLIAIGTRMDLFDQKVIEMENQSKMFLIDMHKRSNICNSSENAGDNLDIDETDKQFKTMKKAFEKQRKKIKKSDTDYENSYNYYYEFH